MDLTIPSPSHHSFYSSLIVVRFSLAKTFGETIGTVLFYQLLMSAIDIAYYTVGIESESSSHLVVCLVGVSSVLLPTFFFCKLSENITTDLEEIGDAFYNCPWYFLAVSQQKTFVLPIHRSQKTYRLTGLGIVSCSLDIFLSVSIALVQLIRSLLLLAQNVI